MIVAQAAGNATSGIAVVQQAGLWSNTVPFTVTRATITNVTPVSGLPGTQVTITGSSFGFFQGNGQLWLGTANGVIQSWGNTQIVATVASGSMTGNAQVLQNGVWSNKLGFTVNLPTVTNLNPMSGVAGTSVTITGSGFGNSQGAGSVQLGSINGNVVTWNNTQVVATVATGSVTGIARVQQGGDASNAVAFTVPSGGGGNSVTLVPYLLNMAIGDARSVQALNPAGQLVSGLTWTSSNPAVASLSNDDPPVISALAAGHATISAGSASCDITVSATGPPNGTVLWSNLGDGSGISAIVPAVPSPNGGADVFAFQNDATIQAITSDGQTLWTAPNPGYAMPGFAGRAAPDFQGGLVIAGQSGIFKIDGATGQPYPAFSPASGFLIAINEADAGNFAVPNVDGMVFASLIGSGNAVYPGPETIGLGVFDPTTGSQKYMVSDTGPGVGFQAGPIVAGDGYAYLSYLLQDYPSGGIVHIKLLRINSQGNSDVISVADVPATVGSVHLITNADQGVLVSWTLPPSYTIGIATTVGTHVTVSAGPALPGPNYYFRPSLQAQDGSFVAFQVDASRGNIVAFSGDGTLRWSVPGDYPLIALSDGSVVGQSAAVYDQTGAATAQIGAPPSYSWLGNAYQSVGGTAQVFFPAPILAASFWAFQGANHSAANTAIEQQWFPPLLSCFGETIPGANCAGTGSPGASFPNWALLWDPRANPPQPPLSRTPGDSIWNAKNDLAAQMSDPACRSAAQDFVFSKIGVDVNNRAVTPEGFANYIRDHPRFYDGSKSTLSYKYAFCGENYLRLNCNGNGLTIKGTFADTGGTTAITVTPSYPFKSFWQPVYSPPGKDDKGFGVGIDPSNYGINIVNESVLFHEALHGITAKYDGDLQADFHVGGASVSISVYIRDNVLSKCPSFR